MIFNREQEVLSLTSAQEDFLLQVENDVNDAADPDSKGIRATCFLRFSRQVS